MLNRWTAWRDRITPEARTETTRFPDREVNALGFPPLDTVTVEVGADVAVPEPVGFEAVTVIRIREPTSSFASR